MENTLTEFTKFGDFAPEIRLEIWHQAIQSEDNPRVFEIGESDGVEHPSHPTLANVNIAKWSCPPRSALLSVCIESNIEYRKRYEAVKFRNQTVYVNFEVDWILLPDYFRYEGLAEDTQWWMFKTALKNDGYWEMIRNLVVPASVWAGLSWTEDLVNGTTVARWPKELEGMPCLERVLMGFEDWAQWEDDHSSFATKGVIEFGNVENFYVCELGGNKPRQWIDFSKDQIRQIKEIKTHKSWKMPDIIYASILRGGKEPLMHELQRENHSRNHDLVLQALLEMADL